MPYSSSRELWLRSDGRALFVFSATNYEGDWADIGDVRIVVLREEITINVDGNTSARRTMKTPAVFSWQIQSSGVALHVISADPAVYRPVDSVWGLESTTSVTRKGWTLRASGVEPDPE